jgi:hypothetical protein
MQQKSYGDTGGEGRNSGYTRRTWRTRRQVIPRKTLRIITRRRVRRVRRVVWWFLPDAYPVVAVRPG